MPKELIFTATYDERANIAWWIEEVAKVRPGSDILIVDDNSPDGTGELVNEMSKEFPQITLHSRVGKLGLSSAHLYALQYAYENDYDVLVTMDADGSHQPSQIARLIEASDSADFVIGTRYRGGSHQAARFRRFLSLGANKAARRLLPMGLSEYTTSFRVFTPSAMSSIDRATFECGGYAFFIECLEVMNNDGLVLAEAPIDFLDRTGGKSKIPRSQILLSAKALLHLNRQRRHAPAIASARGDSR